LLDGGGGGGGGGGFDRASSYPTIAFTGQFKRTTDAYSTPCAFLEYHKPGTLAYSVAEPSRAEPSLQVHLVVVVANLSVVALVDVHPP